MKTCLTELPDNYTVTVDEEIVPFSNYIEYVEGLYKTDEISDDPDYVSVICRLTYAVTRTEITTEKSCMITKELENSELPRAPIV